MPAKQVPRKIPVNLYKGKTEHRRSEVTNDIINFLGGSGAFDTTLSGMSVGSASGEVLWSRTGNLVTLNIDTAISATSNATSMNLTDLPEEVQPESTQSIPCVAIRDGGVDFNSGYAVVTSTSIISLFLTGGAGFTATGLKGLTAGWTITYTLN